MRLPILGAALQSVSPSVLKEVLKEGRGDDSMVVSVLLQCLTEYTLSSEHMSRGRTAAASCVHGLLKSGFDKEANCPVKPLVAIATETLVSSTWNIADVRNCLGFLSMLVS